MYLSLPTFVSKKGRKIAIADPGPPPPLVLDQTEARGTEKISLGDRLPLAPLSKGLDEPPIPPPPPLISRSGSGSSCGLIKDGLFTNWQLGFDSDPRMHDSNLLVLETSD